jgi:hypothetical protein
LIQRAIIATGAIFPIVALVSLTPARLAGQATTVTKDHTSAAASKTTPWTPLRTPWGDPDLQGTFTTDNSIGVPFERLPQYAGRTLLTDEEFAERERANAEQLAKDNSERPETAFAQDTAANNAPRHWLDRPTKPSRATSLVVEPADGRIPPMTPEGQRRLAERRALRASRGESDSYEYHSNYDRCITRGVTGSILPAIYGNGTNIIQGPGFVVIRNEMIHEARLIPIDGRGHVGKQLHMYMGNPLGHWEGSTLVVDSTNFTDKTGLGGNGGGSIHSDNLHLIERFTRVDRDTIHYEFTVDDPTFYTRPWKVALDLTTKPGYGMIYEYACHEGNYGMANMLGAARADEKASQ